VRWVILTVGVELPATLALLDCVNRGAEEFEEGAEDRRAWLRWLAVAVATSVVLVGFGIVLGYYWAVVKRNTAG
jgi:hypothetical protein